MPACCAASWGVASWVLAFALPPLVADPTPSLDQLTVIDQGPQVTVVWHFFYKLLPPKFILREINSQAIDLDDPATLKTKPGRLASAAFALTLDGQPAPLTKISELTVAPDGGCFATLLYPGRQNGRLQLQETLLPYYPSSYVINYEIYSPLDRGAGRIGLFHRRRALARRRPTSSSAAPPRPRPSIGSTPPHSCSSRPSCAWPGSTPTGFSWRSFSS